MREREPRTHSYRGRVDFYRDDGAGWIHDGSLEGTDPSGRFGFDVALEPVTGWLAIGAPDEGVAGHVSLYRKVGNDWVLEVDLTTLGNVSDQFGYCVDLAGNTLAVGNPGNADHRGRVHLLAWNGVQWVMRPSIQHPETIPGDTFGADLDLEPDRLLVGASGHGFADVGAGAAFLYHRSGDDWIDPIRFLPMVSQAFARFGSSVRLAGDVVSVGAYLADYHWDDQGSVYQWRQRGSEWIALQRLVDHRYTGDQYHGFAHAVFGEEVFVGAPGTWAGAERAGAVYVHDLPDFALHLDSHALHLGQPVNFDFCGGDPGQPALIFVVAVHDAPLFLKLASSNFDADGRWSLQGSHANPALSGLLLDFQGFSITSQAKVERSNTGRLELY